MFPIRNCTACGKELAQSLIYTIREDDKQAFCTRTCRATVTGETVSIVEKPAVSKDAPAINEAQPVTKAGKVKAAKKVVQPIAPRIDAANPAPTKPAKVAAAAKPASGKPPGRASSAPWSNLTGKLHLTGKKPPNFNGNRKAVWEMIKEGMTVGKLYEQCTAAGLDGKSNLAKIIGVYGCAEVK